jgi:hypothetical protein
MMSVIIIVSLFFVFGITVGVIAVIAMSARRRYQWHWQPDWPDQASPDQRAPDLDDNSSASDEYQWWKSRDDD